MCRPTPGSRSCPRCTPQAWTTWSYTSTAAASTPSCGTSAHGTTRCSPTWRGPRRSRSSSAGKADLGELTAAGAAAGRVETEVDEQAAPVVAVLLDPVVELLDVLLVE